MTALDQAVTAFFGTDTAFDAVVNAFFGSDAEGKDPVKEGWVGRSSESGEFTAKGAGGGGGAAAAPETARKERNLSVRDILYGDTPAAKPRSKRVKEIARELMDRSGKALEALGVEGGRINGPNPETDALLSRVIASELKDALKQRGHAAHWYSTRMQKAMGIAAEMYPELGSDEHARTAYTACLAVTSQGEIVPSNVRLADEAYQVYRETGRFPTDVKADKQKSMNNNFRKLNGLLDAGTPAELTEFLNTDFTVRELEAIGLDAEGELKDTTVKGSAILGAKIGGGFFQNLNGNYDPVTMDLWFMRGWGRLTNTLQGQLNPKLFDKTRDRFEAALTQAGETVPRSISALQDRAEEISRQHEQDYRKYRAEYDAKTRVKSELVLSAERIIHALDGVNESPTSGGQRQWIRGVINQTRQLLADDGIELNNADMQALWWYPEKDLYTKMGGRESRRINVDYADALQDLARQRGIAESAIARAMGTMAGRPGPGSDADLGGGGARLWQESHGLAPTQAPAARTLDQAVNAFFGQDRAFREEDVKRDKEGKFAEQASSTFVSPNVASNLKFKEARQALSGRRQQALSAVSQRIDQRLGLHDTQSADVIGAWATGAENSLMTLTTGDPQLVRAAAAMKGAITNQLAVLVFQPGAGEHQMASFELQGDLAGIHEQLLQGGLEFHTLEPTEGGAKIHILVMDDDTADKIATAAGDAEIDIVNGSGEFIGTEQQTGTDAEQREDAQRVYREIIDQMARERQGQGPDLRAIWQDADDHWHRATAGATDTALDRAVAAFFGSDREFRESDVKRDEGGKFATQASGGKTRPRIPLSFDPDENRIKDRGEFVKYFTDKQTMRFDTLATIINTARNLHGFRLLNPDGFKSDDPIRLEDESFNMVELDVEPEDPDKEVKSMWDLTASWTLKPADALSETEWQSGSGYGALFEAIKALPGAERRQQQMEEHWEERRRQVTVGAVKSAVEDAVKKLGYDFSKVEFSDEVKTFMLGGREATYAGAAHVAKTDPKKGTIVIYNKMVTPETVGKLAAHEVMHQKYQTLIDDYEEEVRKEMLKANPAPEKNPLIEAAEKYMMPRYHQEMRDQMTEADGVSEYSREWWQEYHDGNATWTQAAHETLAEMASLKWNYTAPPHGGRALSQGQRDWRDLYQLIETHYRMKGE